MSTLSHYASCYDKEGILCFTGVGKVQWSGPPCAPQSTRAGATSFRGSNCSQGGLLTWSLRTAAATGQGSWHARGGGTHTAAPVGSPPSPHPGKSSRSRRPAHTRGRPPLLSSGAVTSSGNLFEVPQWQVHASKRSQTSIRVWHRRAGVWGAWRPDASRTQTRW